MGWIKEFGYQYAVPESIQSVVKDGFTQDVSWHNDTAPSFGFVDPHKPEWDIRLWVEHPDPMKREDPGQARYGVQVVKNSEVLEQQSFTAPIPAKEFYRKMLVKYLDPKIIRREISDKDKAQLDRIYEEIIGYRPSKDSPTMPLDELRDLTAEVIWLNLGGSEAALKK